MKIYFAFALLLLCYAVGADDPECGKHEEYTECGADCQHTCENPHPKICTAVCREGCLCKEGYLRNAEGKCIRAEKCPSSCGPNEEHSGCVVPCNDCVTKGDCQFLACNEGCDCITGYYRDVDANCIPECKCPKECGENAEYNECGSACQPTCQNPDPQVCTLECRLGCFCKEGYLENDDGECVKPDECPSNLPTCQQPPKTGNCYGAFWRFYYNPKKGKCEEFLYGGCNGNDNNFETVEECEEACCRKETCRQPPVTGPCDGDFPRFYYNPKSGKCEGFTYGGCDGNKNNFETIEECEKTCHEKGGHGGSGSATATAAAAGGGNGGHGGSGSSAATAAASS